MQIARLCLILQPYHADVVELVDTPDLGSGAERYAGSSPSFRTIVERETERERVMAAGWRFTLSLSVSLFRFY
jgi:hypothetical protein